MVARDDDMFHLGGLAPPTDYVVSSTSPALALLALLFRQVEIL
jgi:hypothetical protein